MRGPAPEEEGDLEGDARERDDAEEVAVRVELVDEHEKGVVVDDGEGEAHDEDEKPEGGGRACCVRRLCMSLLRQCVR